MLENHPPSAPDAPSAVVRRYSPPNRRNRSLGWRKSGGYGDNNAPRNVPINEHRDIGIGNFPNESPHSGYIPLEGCCCSRAYQLLSDRWAAAIRSCNDPSIDLSVSLFMQFTDSRETSYVLGKQWFSLRAHQTSSSAAVSWSFPRLTDGFHG